MTETTDEKERAAAEITAEASKIFQLGRFDEALTMYERAIALDPRNARAHGGRSLSLTQLGRHEEGLAAAAAAVDAAPAYSPSYTVLAFCHHRLGREAEALAAFEKALALGPEEPRVLYNVACYWAEMGDEAKCRGFLARAFDVVEPHTLDLAPRDPDLARFAGQEWFRELLAAAKRKRAAARAPAKGAE